MKEYEVIVEFSSFAINVTASSKEEAELKAINRAQEDIYDYVTEINICPNTTSVIENT